MLILKRNSTNYRKKIIIIKRIFSLRRKTKSNQHQREKLQRVSFTSANVHVSTRKSELVLQSTWQIPNGVYLSPKDSISAVRTIERSQATQPCLRLLVEVEIETERNRTKQNKTKSLFSFL